MSKKKIEGMGVVGQLTDNSFDDTVVEETIALQEGEIFTGYFIGKGEPMDALGFDGEPGSRESWLFEANGSNFRILGATMLDNKLADIEKVYTLPCILKIAKTGKTKTRANRELSQFKVGIVEGSKKSDAQTK
jgi:hypothetical protein